MTRIALLLFLCSTHASGQTFRLLEWNVSDSAWLKQAAATRAVLRHADPDVFVLVQVAPSIDTAAIRRVLSGLRGPSDTTWFVRARANDAYEQTVIASRDTVRERPELAGRVPYDTGALARLAAIPDTGPMVPPRDRVDNVREIGAMVRVGGHSVFVVGVHLMCCGTAGMWREYRRQVAAITLRDRVRLAMSHGPPAAVIIAGDMNLVSGSAPLDTLLATTSARPPGPMRRAEAIRPDGGADWTWDGRGTQFENGRLDNVVYSAGVLSVVRARVWDTESMPTDTLSAHGLTAATSSSIGRHRPVVVDFQLTDK